MKYYYSQIYKTLLFTNEPKKYLTIISRSNILCVIKKSIFNGV